MTQEPTSLLPAWARTPTTRRPKSRRHQLPISSGAMEEADDHRPHSSTGRPFLSGLCAAALRRKPLGAHTSTAASGEGLVRQLGVLELVLLGIGASIGAGIFVVTGTVARDAGPGVTISFVLAGAACVLNALCYAELASRFPAVVGGAYMYTYAAFNEITAFLVFTQLMVDYHIGAASIARSLASYFIQFLELIPFLKGHIPNWIGHGEEFFGGVISINILAPILLILLTAILCYGVKESSAVNTFMTTLKIVIVIVVVFAGVFEVDVSNWSPFMPNGFKSVVTGATVVFFAYVGFDAVANSAEEAKRPQRDLPIGILGSLLACVLLYVAVCLVITGMVPYTLLGEDAPLAEAFAAKGLEFVTVLISIGAVVGLTTTLLVGLYVQSRLYLGLGRDGLLPSIFARVHPTRHTPLHSQIWVGCVAAVMAGVTISFVLARAACVLYALCYAELASRFPAVVGGAYLYTYAAFNEIIAFLVFTQLMVDYHIGAASIARSLASYFIQFLELILFLKGHFPSWIGHGEDFFGGVVSINILGLILLILLTAILCYGVKESSAVNTFMTTLEVANSAEETKRPQRDLPIGILGSLLACILLYIAVCLVITGMVPYAPLAKAFAAKGLKFVTVLISIGAVAGLTTTLLVGLYVQQSSQSWQVTSMCTCSHIFFPLVL